MASPLLDAVLARHQAFWSRAPAAAPMQRRDRYQVSREGLAPMRLPLADGTDAVEGCLVTPEMLAPERIHPQFGPDVALAAFGRTLGAQATGAPSDLPAMNGDLFVAAAAYPKVPWIEAILGCPIRASLRSHSLWAEPFVSAAELPTYQLRPDERWVRKLLEFTRWLVANSQGRSLVSHTLMRGISDMLVAMLGDELFCSALYEAPDAIHRLAAQCRELFLDMVWAQLAQIPPFEGGYCNLFGLWAPGTAVRTQDDAATLLSPRHYAEFILPHQQQLAGSFGYSILHLHSVCLHIADLICESDLTAVQVSIDPVPFGPTVMELIPHFARILEKKPLLVEGPMTEAEYEALRAALPTAGLCINASIESEEERRRITGNE